MENLLILNRSREGGFLISLFEGKKLILERKLDFLSFNNRDDTNRLFSVIKANWQVDLIFKSGSSFFHEKVFVIKKIKSK